MYLLSLTLRNIIINIIIIAINICIFTIIIIIIIINIIINIIIIIIIIIVRMVKTKLTDFLSKSLGLWIYENSLWIKKDVLFGKKFQCRILISRRNWPAMYGSWTKNAVLLRNLFTVHIFFQQERKCSFKILIDCLFCTDYTENQFYSNYSITSTKKGTIKLISCPEIGLEIKINSYYPK